MIHRIMAATIIPIPTGVKSISKEISIKKLAPNNTYPYSGHFIISEHIYDPVCIQLVYTKNTFILCPVPYRYEAVKTS